MSAAQSQERVLEYLYLTLGGVDNETNKRYPPKWGMQYSLLVSKDQGHMQMAVISLETQMASLQLLKELESKSGYSVLSGKSRQFDVSDIFGGYFESQRMGILAGRSIKGAFLNAVTSAKQQLQANYTGMEQKKPSIMEAFTGKAQPQQSTSLV